MNFLCASCVFGGCSAVGKYIFCWLHFLFCQYFYLTVGWTPLQLTCLSKWTSWILDVLLIRCISLQYFLAAMYWAIYSSVYRICRTPSSSNPGSWSVILLTLNPPSQPLISSACHLSVHFSFSRCLSSFSLLPLQPLITLKLSQCWTESKTTYNIPSVLRELQIHYSFFVLSRQNQFLLPVQLLSQPYSNILLTRNFPKHHCSIDRAG